jgi:hypothetical protein
MFSFSKYPNRSWGPSDLLLHGYVGALSPGVKRLGVRLTTLLHLVPRLRISGASPPLLPTVYVTLFHNELFLKDYMKFQLDVMFNGDDKLIGITVY